MCWCKLLAQCRCGKCGILCCARDKKNPKGSPPGQNAETMPLTVRYENQNSTTISSHGRSDIQKGSQGDQTISIPICDTTTELSVVQHKMSDNDFSPQRFSQCSASGDRPTPPLTKVVRHNLILNLKSYVIFLCLNKVKIN